MSERHFNLIIIIIVTLIAAIGDSLGFVYAAQVWKAGKLIWKELAKSAIGFWIGNIGYWIAVRYLIERKVISPEIQTIIWFITTVIIIAILSGRFFKWQLLDQIVGIGVMLGVGWLIFRTTN